MANFIGPTTWALSGAVVKKQSAHMGTNTGVSFNGQNYTDSGLSMTYTPTASGNVLFIWAVHNYNNKANSGSDCTWYTRLHASVGGELDDVHHRGDNLGKLGDTIHFPTSHVQFYAYTTTGTSAITFKTQVKTIATSNTLFIRHNSGKMLILEVAA
jgi:hypothetical protein